VGRRLLDAALKDSEVWARVLALRCNLACAEATFDDQGPVDVSVIHGFEDVHWLYSANALNQRLSRLELNEAAYLYRLVRLLGRPRVAELGRFKGGTTFLLAAAGARVTSLDIAAAQQAVFDPPLERALERFDLSPHVELVVADLNTYPVTPQSFEVVFLDHITHDGVPRAIEHWWPGLVTEGHLIVHLVDPEEDRWPTLAERFGPAWSAVDEFTKNLRAIRAEGAPASFAHLVKR
jgi:SAM-dependent methyltransferase